MSLRIFHTGDIHLGMRFNRYGEKVRENLFEARFNSLENMIIKSNELDTDIFVIAGDLFNAIQIAKRDISRTAEILNKFNGRCVLVLPGNHDYDNGVVELWNEFRDKSNDKVLIINEERPYSLEDYDLDVLVYPAPCDNKHSEENSLGWIKEEDLSNDSKYNIGVAHGALEGLSADIEGNYYYMSMEELNSIPMDLWLIGHTHVRYPLVDKISNHKIYNAGTHEPDGLNYRYDGSAWLIDLEKDKINTERIITGEYRFYSREFDIDSEDDLEEIKEWVFEGNPKKKIVRLYLNGSLAQDIYENINEFYKELESELFYLLIEDDNLKIKVDRETIENEFTRGSFPYEFLTALDHDEEAMQIAYDLLRRE